MIDRDSAATIARRHLEREFPDGGVALDHGATVATARCWWTSARAPCARLAPPTPSSTTWLAAGRRRAERRTSSSTTCPATWRHQVERPSPGAQRGNGLLRTAGAMRLAALVRAVSGSSGQTVSRAGMVPSTSHRVTVLLAQAFGLTR